MRFLGKEPADTGHTHHSHDTRHKAKGFDIDELNAFLGQGCTYQGKLTFEGAVRIDGVFTGEILSDGVLIIGEGARIEADIEVRVMIISGRVHGDIHATERVELRSPAHLEGNIYSPTLVVEEGVFFEGTCRMKGAATRSTVASIADTDVRQKLVDIGTLEMQETASGRG